MNANVTRKPHVLKSRPRSPASRVFGASAGMDSMVMVTRPEWAAGKPLLGAILLDTFLANVEVPADFLF